MGIPSYSILTRSSPLPSCITVWHSVRYFIFEGNVIVLPATMKLPLPR
jgi:hypothetical protein